MSIAKTFGRPRSTELARLRREAVSLTSERAVRKLEAWAAKYPDLAPRSFYPGGLPYDPLPPGVPVPIAPPQALWTTASATDKAIERSLLAYWRARVRPGTLGGPVDDLAAEVADTAYDEIKARFYEDKDQLVDDVIATATPKVKDAVEQMLSDADTQARIGRTEASLRNGMILIVGTAALATMFGTWLLVRYVK